MLYMVVQSLQAYGSVEECIIYMQKVSDLTEAFSYPQLSPYHGWSSSILLFVGVLHAFSCQVC